MSREDEVNCSTRRMWACFFAALTLSVVACAPQPIEFRQALQNEGEVHIYLQPLPREARRIVLHVASLSVVREDGQVIGVPPLFDELVGADLVGVQRRLASAVLPPGPYAGISVQIDAASVSGEDGVADLLVPEEPVFIAQEFSVARRRAEALFLSLDRAHLIESGIRFTPHFTLAKSRRQLRSLLGFATNSDMNLVTVFNKHSMEIVDAIATGSGPMGTAIDERRGWVYVALAGDNAIEAIDIDTGEVFRRIQLNLGDRPTELALSIDGLTLVSANRGSNTASIIDATFLRELDRVSLSSEPWAVVPGTASPRVYVLQPRSNAVSVINLSRREIVATEILDDVPLRGAVSSDGNLLFVITRHSSDVLVIDAQSLVVRGRINVGAGATSIKVDSKTGLAYVGKERSGISVLDPSSLLPIDRFRISGHTEFLTIDDDANSLFVLMPERRTIQKLDLVSKKLRGAIELGDGGYSLVLMGGR